MPELKPQLQSVQSSRAKQVEKREQPDPSTVWQAFAIGFLFSAAATLVTSLTLSPGAKVRPSELLIMAAGLALMGVLCFLAHWDANRGRKPKRYLPNESTLSEFSSSDGVNASGEERD
jgi:hypothetical protein